MVECLNGKLALPQPIDLDRCAYFNHIEIHDHTDGGANFVFQAMHFKAHALKHYFSSGSDGYLFQKVGDSARVQSCRR
jgi:hypothetical protein